MSPELLDLVLKEAAGLGRDLRPSDDLVSVQIQVKAFLKSHLGLYDVIPGQF